MESNNELTKEINIIEQSSLTGQPINDQVNATTVINENEESFQSQQISEDILKTKKKEFESKIVPHEEIRKVQQDQCVWLGVYDHLLKKDKLLKIIKECKNSTLPFEWIAIHLDKFKVYFGGEKENSSTNTTKNVEPLNPDMDGPEIIDENIKKADTNERNITTTPKDTKKTCPGRVYIVDCPNSVAFLKLYLINKNQFIEILSKNYGIQFNLNEDMNKEIFNKLKEVNNSLIIDETNDYGKIHCCGELEGIKILTATSPCKREISPPDVNYLKTIYSGLKKAFSPYSSYLIMYYIYRLDGIRSNYSIENLIEVFYKTEIKSISKSSSYMKNQNFEENKLNPITEESEQNTNNANNPQDKQNIKEETIPLSKSNTLKNNNFIYSNNFNQDNNEVNKEINSNTAEKTVVCATCTVSPNININTPEKDHINKYSHILDLHHLPVFDENTGEFMWSNSDTNWKMARDSIMKSEEINNGRSMDIRNGSIISMSSSLLENKEDLEDQNNINNINLPNITNFPSSEKWKEFKKEKKEGTSTGTLVEELNNLLKNLES